MPTEPALHRYRAKRDFSQTPEPEGGGRAHPHALQFVVQKHWATRLHYDFRLELGGRMLSWAVPKGPSLDPADKRMAVHVEDHPIAYNRFEGRIPPGQYGAGKVIVWDKGRWVPRSDPAKGLRAGKLEFELHGHKLHGHWTLVRMHGHRDDKQEPWLLIKGHDEFERSHDDFSIIDAAPDSVAKLPPPKDEAAAPTPAEVVAGTAPRHALPTTLAPMLATLVDQPPADAEDWLFEVKFDGYRVLAHIGPRHGVRLMTRNGHDWSRKLPHLVDALAALKLEPGWLDGEIVVPGEHGASDFQALQNAFDSAHTERVQYHLFDLPFHAGRDLRSLPLEQRRALLQSLLAGVKPPLHFSEAFDAPPKDLLASACQLGLEGLIGKRRDGAYASGRSRDWIKLKCSQRQEFVIGGWTEPQGSRSGLGALLLGVHDADGALRYAGKVGSGFNERNLQQLRARLDTLASERRPFAQATDSDRGAHWVKPSLVAEVSFSAWTRDGRLRHPVFHALRSDKPAKAIVREQPLHALGPDVEQAEPALPARLRVSNPDRLIDPSSNTTKLELVRFYAQVAPLMMEHLRERPVALLRAPRGIRGPSFFQKHIDPGEIEGLRQLDPALDPGHPPLTEVARAAGIVHAAQMNVVEFHSWNALRTRIDRPDRLSFDLDPGEGVAWRQVREGAELLRVFLEELGLVGFVKTSGGKGLHVIVPIKRLAGWDAARGFTQAVVQHMAATLPQLFVARSGASNRVGKIFIDYLRNGFGATTVCAWSARARPGLGVSVPIAWEELAELDGAAHWTVRNIEPRLAIGNRPWARYAHSARGLGPAIKRLG
jgi:bifunctional non-homologous end joining protein LigD